MQSVLSKWSGGLAEWIEGDTAYISVVFSWKLQAAYQRAIWYKSQGYKVRAGGIGTLVHKDYLKDVAELGGDVDALPHHNPRATIASHGCPVGCYFCSVPKMEGKTFTLLPDFTPRNILCDNNVSALPVEYQEYIIDKYKKANVPLLDINSGFEPHTFNEDTYNRWREIYDGYWRFGFDETSEEESVINTVRVLKDVPSRHKRVYTIIGNEPYEQCVRRVLKVIEWQCEPWVQPFIAPNSLEKKPVVKFDWTLYKLQELQAYANSWRWRSTSFADYQKERLAKAKTKDQSFVPQQVGDA